MKESITGCSKQELLNRLQALQIHFSKYDHPVALTVEAQAKYVGHVKGALTKNLFFKDKKHRYYIVSALPDTKVDLKVLSQRLGLGKGALRMAPEEALGQLLQVPLGCVTPFALVNESARHVSLLLDQGFKNQECCFFHPLSNDTTICGHMLIIHIKVTEVFGHKQPSFFELFQHLMNNLRFHSFKYNIFPLSSHITYSQIYIFMICNSFPIYLWHSLISYQSEVASILIIPSDLAISLSNLASKTNFIDLSPSPLHRKILVSLFVPSDSLKILHGLKLTGSEPIDLDKFLNSVGKAPAYVDLEAKPSVGKDHPPDLGFLVPSDGLILPNSLHNTGPVKNQDLDSLKPAGANAKAVKPSSSGTQNNKLVNVVKTPTSLTDPSTFIEEILEKTSSIVLHSGLWNIPKRRTLSKDGEELGAIVLIKSKTATMEFKNMATIFKNTAYTEGFHAGIHQLPRRL
ncbi:hypothetical protein Leryth_018968 [Lithospermum erythrorhizon]|nr:hypothetical protein Leryth_018968 [Lithospermum erythrorhizon]